MENQNVAGHGFDLGNTVLNGFSIVFGQAQNLSAGIFQRCFRYGIGSAVFLAAPVVSAAAPKFSDSRLFAAIVMSADAAPDQRGELGSFAP